LVFSTVAIGPHHMSFHSKFHYVVGSLTFFLAPVCAFCFAVTDRSAKDATWQTFRRWSVVLGVAMASGLILMKLATIPPPTNPMQPWRGLIQRGMILPFVVWLFAFGVVLLKRGSHSLLPYSAGRREGSDENVRGERAMVTGAASGIGRTIALRLGKICSSLM
jgi:hypothetical protein